MNEMPLSGFDPLVREWFSARFGDVTEPERLGWPVVRAGGDVLISAPTGTGKTLAAFLTCIDGLVRRAREGPLEDRIEAVYVSPLKALSNDVHKNLETPLAEIRELAEGRGIKLAAIRAAVRTGDTLAWERQAMLRRPPHILVTTPESLFILLTAEKSRRMLATTRTLIVDEIHAVVDDKRGSHLALTLARLDAVIAAAGGARPQRIGLSATVNPVDEVARFLGGDPAIVQVGHRRDMELAVEVPRDELGAAASTEMWGEIYDRLAELISQHRTTLVFVNTRRLAERISHHLGERLGPKAVLPHHGSLSRKLRLEAEQRLKKGELRAVVATASLELGIDIGTVDLVCQIGSPRSIAVALQRIGRSGHVMSAVPKGRLFATTRDELLECAAVVRAIRQGELDRLEIPRAPLDILAQQIVAEAAAAPCREDDLYALVRRAYPYRDLARADFDAVIEMLSEGFATARGRSGAMLHRDRVNGVVRGRRGARLAAMTSGGAIPDTSNYAVVADPESVTVGTVDEEFAVESAIGDVFLLGTSSWRIRRLEPGRVRVENARGAAPSIPFWRGEAPGRTAELSREFARVREEAARREPGEAGRWLASECGLEERGASEAIDYARAGEAALGALPSSSTVVAERFFDEAGGMQLVIHAPFGARINRAWGLALRHRLNTALGASLQAAATDNGIVISLGEQHSFPLDAVFEFVRPETAEAVLKEAVLDAPMFAARWRWNVSRALAIPRFAGGRKVPPPIQRMRAEDLLDTVFPGRTGPAPDHPLIAQTISDCLHEAMDLNGLVELLKRVQAGEVRTVAVETPDPSPFSHEILNANPYAFLDDTPMEERRTRAVQLRRTLAPEVAASIGALDADAIAQVAAESWPEVRDAEELHDALQTLVVAPPAPQWQAWFDLLRDARRTAAMRAGATTFWVAAERLPVVRAAYPDGLFDAAISTPTNLRAAPATREEAVAEILRGWLESTGPATAEKLAHKLALEPALIERALVRLEAEGQLLRGRFRPGATETEWCNRRLLARIHRLTIGRLRNEIEPVSAADFVRFLTRWQHAARGSQLHGVEGTLEIVRQLQGYEAPAAAWEAEILPRRVARYSPEFLDRLCLSGEVMWGRISPHPAFENGAAGRRVRPTRVAPVTLMLREDAEAMLAFAAPSGSANLSHPARDVLAALEERGASFFGDLVRAAHRLPSEVEDGLWELVAAGLVTADGFENLRALIDPKRRRGEGRGKRARPRHAAGRWALLRGAASEPSIEPLARQLLRRWGVVFRDILARETIAPPWRDLLVVLRRMEARGEARGGRFVAGFTGEQFAAPEAVDVLRAVRRAGSAGEEIAIGAADPLNLAGVVLPGPRVSAATGGRVRVGAYSP